jgi:hypothetical protein
MMLPLLFEREMRTSATGQPGYNKCNPNKYEQRALSAPKHVRLLLANQRASVCLALTIVRIFLQYSLNKLLELVVRLDKVSIDDRDVEHAARCRE